MTKPWIGITPSSIDKQANLQHDYMEWITRSGGIPLVLAYTGGEADAEELAEGLDGLMLSGGADVDPYLFGEEPIRGLGTITPDRDRGELALIRAFVRRNKPVFGICRGIQVLNVAMGGTLYQDLLSQSESLQHSQKAPASYATQRIDIEPGSKLAGIAVGAGLIAGAGAGARAGASLQVRVNSFHHQAVKEAAPGLTITARSADGVIEAVESTAHRFLLGVQWHPEKMDAGDALSAGLFSAFVAACKPS